MSTDLEQQLARFAEALDREAPTISFDDMVGRGTVSVEVDALERRPSDRAFRVDSVPGIDPTPSHDETDEPGVLIELPPAVVVRRPAWRRTALKVALGAAAVAVLVVAVAALERSGDEPDPAEVPPATFPTPTLTPRTSPDGEVTVSAPEAWKVLWSPPGGLPEAIWFGMVWPPGPAYIDTGEGIGLVDPVAYDAWCAENGGSPLLSAPADAEAIAQQLITDPDFETTAPMAARVGGLDAVSIDVALAPDGEPCGLGMFEVARWIHWLAPGKRLRVYLVDLPEGMSVETLAITAVAAEERFEEFIEETAPIVESIEFHPTETASVP